MESDEEESDKRILTLAAEIAEANDREVPTLLLKVRDVFNEEQPGSKKLSSFKRDIWSYELLQVLILTLKQNFDYTPGRWKVAAELASFTSAVCMGLDPPESHEYYGICLPNASENMLMLAKRLQTKYISEDNEMAKTTYMDHFTTTLDALSILFSTHIFLTTNVLRSSWLLQLLISDDANTAHAALNLVRDVIRTNTDVMATLDEKVIHSILDEMVFKLTSSESKYVASSAMRTLTFLCEVRPYFIQIICGRYRGLRPLMSKWSGQGFGRDLKDFVGLLDAGNARRVETEKFHRAATLIQSVWRSFRTRKSLKKASVGFTKLQRTIRYRKKQQQAQKDEEALQSELKYQLLVSRKQAMRMTREKQMEILDMLPPSAVQKYLEDLRKQAAIKIQSTWRGFQTREKLAGKKVEVRRIKSAVIIQRQIRRFLAKMSQLRNDPPAWQKAASLTDETRVQLQKMILERRETNPPKARTREEQESLHNNCQDSLKRHVFVNRVNRRKQQHREALLAELNTDSDLLLNAPNLHKLEACDIETFSSKSVPIATKARENHNNELKTIGQPWWRKLGDEYQDCLYEDEQIFL